MKASEFNINNEVKVKLTAEALAIHRRKFEELHKTYPHALGEYAPPKVDADGWSKFQLWQLMHDFGPHMFCGSDQLFEDNIVWVHGWDDEPQSDKPRDEKLESILSQMNGTPDMFRECVGNPRAVLARICATAKAKAKRKKLPEWSIIGDVTGHGSGVSAAIYEYYRDYEKPEPVKPAPLQLRKGACFLMRQQGETGPLHKVEQEDYVWSDGTHSWTAEGRYWASDWDSPYDLIAEVPPPVEPEVAQELAAREAEFAGSATDEQLRLIGIEPQPATGDWTPPPFDPDDTATVSGCIAKPQPDPDDFTAIGCIDFAGRFRAKSKREVKDADGWIAHDGKGCPVARSQRVMIRVYGFPDDS